MRSMGTWEFRHSSGGGESRNPVGNRVVPPKFLGGVAPDTAGKDRRQILADWIASPENPYFPRHIANLVWAQYMGRGIVEPVDDVRISNPASNPELLEALSKKIVEYNYDLRKIVRDVCTSTGAQATLEYYMMRPIVNGADDRGGAIVLLAALELE